MATENVPSVVQAPTVLATERTKSRDFLIALATAVGLSIAFFVIYGGSNWIASQRKDVGTWYYDWERFIPFVPLMIIPYMSIDLFFFAAPFLCKNPAERRLLAGRCLLAMAAAGIVWLFMPLTLVVHRPHVDGWLSFWNNFTAMDQPHNLCPSLHIGLRTILADFYAMRLAGIRLLASHIWFSLIGFSTLLTYQHHVVDVCGGFVLATVCMYLLQASPLVQSVTPNRRIGAYYAVGSILLLAGAWYFGGWAFWLLWPMTSTGLVAAGYFALGPGIYRKANGRLPLSTRVVLGPVLWGQWLSLVYYKRQCRAWDTAAPGVLIGRQLNDREASEAIQQGVTAILDLTGEFSEAKPFRQTTYRPLPILDLTAPTLEQLHQAVEFISSHALHGKVYVHCKIGYSRSAAVVAAYLLASRQADSADAAMAHLRQIRPTIVIRPEAQQAIRDFQQRGLQPEVGAASEDGGTAINLALDG